MSIFCYKKLSKPIKLGEVFKKARQEKEISLEQASVATHIPKKYLIAIESGNFNNLPEARVYRLSYLKHYAKFLELEEKILSRQFIFEGGLSGVKEKITPIKKLKRNTVWSVSTIVKNLALLGCVVLFCGYLTFQIKGILEPPKLVIHSPSEGFVAQEMAITIQGETDKECHLTINGESIQINESGQFNPKINLTEGVNTIVVAATKKHGKTTSVTRHVVVKNNQISFNNK